MELHFPKLQDTAYVLSSYIAVANPKPTQLPIEPLDKERELSHPLKITKGEAGAGMTTCNPIAEIMLVSTRLLQEIVILSRTHML